MACRGDVLGQNVPWVEQVIGQVQVQIRPGLELDGEI
jgi:hypothetical protein